MCVALGQLYPFCLSSHLRLCFSLCVLPPAGRDPCGSTLPARKSRTVTSASLRVETRISHKMIGSLITPTFPGGVQSTHTFYSSNLALSPAVQNNQTVSSAMSAIYTAHHECSPPPSERPWSLPRDDPAERRVALPYIDCEFVRVPVNCMRCSGPVASSALSVSLSLSLAACHPLRPSG